MRPGSQDAWVPILALGIAYHVTSGRCCQSLKIEKRAAQVVSNMLIAVRNRERGSHLQGPPMGTHKRYRCPLAERDLAGFIKYLPPRHWQWWSQKGTWTSPGSSV